MFKLLIILSVGLVLVVRGTKAEEGGSAEAEVDLDSFTDGQCKTIIQGWMGSSDMGGDAGAVANQNSDPSMYSVCLPSGDLSWYQAIFLPLLTGASGTPSLPDTLTCEAAKDLDAATFDPLLTAASAPDECSTWAKVLTVLGCDDDGSDSEGGSLVNLVNLINLVNLVNLVSLVNAAIFFFRLIRRRIQ